MPDSTTPSVRHQAFVNAQRDGKRIIYTPKNTAYDIVGLGIAKDDIANKWEESVSYSDGTQNYTRFTRDMGNFDIEDAEPKSEPLDKPNYLTVVFQINDHQAFAPINNMLMKSLGDFDPIYPPSWGVVSASHSHEMLRLDLIEEALEDDDIETAREILNETDIQYKKGN